MAWRRLARDAAAHLRRGASPARSFSASCLPPAANPILLGRHGVQQSIWSRCSISRSSPAFQAGVPKFGAFLTARMPPGVRTKLPGLMKGFGTGGAALAVMLYPKKVADAKEGKLAERPSEDIAVPSENSKQVLSELWNFVRKYQLTVGLILLIAYGWRKPIVLLINIMLLLYSSRPDPYSIYLFLQEFVQTRKVDTADYKFFSIGTVELKDQTVLHVIGILGSWWIYHVSYVKREERMWHNFPF